MSNSSLPADRLIIGSSQLLTLTGSEGLASVKGGAVALSGERILETGTTADLLDKYKECSDIIDAEGRLVMPGFVDCHTHAVFSGCRTREMEMRLAGASYLEILKGGGGIHSTVESTRKAAAEELFVSAYRRLNAFLDHGTTSLEIKSGYGLEYETERKMLSVINRLKWEHPADIVTTYLGAHTFPGDISRKEYMEWLKGESLSEFSEMADYFDLFCEEGAFSRDEAGELLSAAREAGFGLKIHAGQFTDLGAAGLAAEMGAVSADHLENIDDGQIKRMAQNGCTAVLMPGVPFFLQGKIFPDGRKFVDSGVSVALATDFNPGSCPSFSMPMMISLGIFSCGLTVSEALRGATVNAARAIGLEQSVGSLESGKKADIILLDIETPEELPYYFGTNPVSRVIKAGRDLVF